MGDSDYVLTHEGGSLVFQATRPDVGLPTCDITAEEIHTGEQVYLWKAGDAYRVVTVAAYARLCRFHFGSPDPLKDPFTNKAFAGPIHTVTALVRTSTGEPDLRVSAGVAAARAASVARFMGGGAASAASASAPAAFLGALMEKARKDPVFRVAGAMAHGAAAAADAAASFAAWLATKAVSMCESAPPPPYTGGAGMFGIHPPRRRTRQRRRQRRQRHQSRRSRRS